MWTRVSSTEEKGRNTEEILIGGAPSLTSKSFNSALYFENKSRILFSNTAIPERSVHTRPEFKEAPKS